MIIDRLLIIGHGSIGKRHLRIARSLLPDADIRVLKHQPTSYIPEYANGCFSDIKSACEFSPQAAVIANPAPFHLGCALPLAKLGCHLLVEKPISDTVDQITTLMQEVRSKGVILQVGYNLRFLSTLQKFKHCIQSNHLGRILSVRCEIGQYLPTWRPDSDYRQSVSAQRELGGGILLELSHEFDYLRWVFGDITWASAWFGKQSSLDINVEDTALIRLGFGPDSSGFSSVGSLNIDCVRHDPTRVCTAIGEFGTIRWNGMTNLVEEYRTEVGEWTPLYQYTHHRDDSYREQLKHFLKCIATQTLPAVTGEDGYAVLNIIQAIHDSHAQQGTSVDIPLSTAYPHVTTS